MRTHNFRFVDLFAGVGGFHHALSALGGKCVFACELDPECRQVYSSAFPGLKGKLFPADIRALTRLEPADESSIRPSHELKKLIPEHDVLCAGFPCQPFSKSGHQHGVKDRVRGTLFFDILQIVEARKPLYLLLENVRNLAGPRHVNTWRTIVQAIREQGYDIRDDPFILSPHRLSPSAGGAPQVRDRVFILAKRRGVKTSRAIALPEPSASLIETDWSPDNWDIRSYLAADSASVSTRSYQISPREETWIRAWDCFVRIIDKDQLPGFPIWAFALKRKPSIPADCPAWKENFLRKNAEFYVENRAVLDKWLGRTWGTNGETVLQFPESRQKFEWQARKAHPTRKGRTLSNLVLQFRPSGIRVKPATYLPALVAITQTSILGPQVTNEKAYRRLMPSEAARLQGIPYRPFVESGTSDDAVYRQLGNAVNVGVVQYVFRSLVDCRAQWTGGTGSSVSEGALLFS